MNKLQYEIFKLKGIVKDIAPIELMNGARPAPGAPYPNVWTAGSNVHFDDDSTHRVGGYAPFADDLPTGAEPIFALNALTPAESFWIWVDGQAPSAPVVYVTDGVTHFDISPTVALTGGEPGQWSGCILNNVPVINNQVDQPLWWDGNTGAAMQLLPDWPATQRCKAIRAYKYHLIALNLTRDAVQIPDMYAWSSAADPGTIPQEWAPTPSNDAGDNIVATGPGGLIDGLTLRDDFILYKSHSTFIMSYIAGQYVFAQRKLFNSSGIQALNCVKELQGRHWVYTDDDLITHDGNTFQSIADLKVREVINSGINPDTQQLAHVAVDTPKDEIWFCVPTVDNTRLVVALVYSFKDEQFGVRGLPNVTYVENGIIPNPGADPSWDGATLTWDQDDRRWSDSAYNITNDQLLMCSPDVNKLYNVDLTNDNDGQPVYSYVERTDWTIGGEGMIWDNVLIRTIYPIVTGSPGDTLTISAAGTQVAGDPVKWVKGEFTIGSSSGVDLMSYGRYLNLRVESTGGDPWELHRIGIEYINESKY